MGQWGKAGERQPERARGQVSKGEADAEENHYVLAYHVHTRLILVHAVWVHVSTSTYVSTKL